MKLLCAWCKTEIGELLPGVSGITSPGIRDSKSGTTFYAGPNVSLSHGICESCLAKHFAGTKKTA